MGRRRVHVFISGVVQGVFFRANTQERAVELGLTGWVKNLRDGRVEAVFEGEEKAVSEILRWCEGGPPGARVTRLDVREETFVGEFTDFSVVYR